MTRKIVFFAALALLALILAGCASLGRPSPEARLRSELQRWQNFSAAGVVQASHSGLALRKMFVLAKTPGAVRLDVLDGGVLGINPEPLVSLYLGDYLAVKAPVMPAMENVFLDGIQFGNPLGTLANPDSLIARYGAAIIRDRKLTIDKTVLTFNDAYQLTVIQETGTPFRIDVSYNRKGDPDQVKVVADAKTSVELFVDSISYGDARIVPLPRNEKSGLMGEILKAVEELLPLDEAGEQ